MPSRKSKWDWVIRRYNYETGKHEILEPIYKTKEEAQTECNRLKKYDKLKNRPFNYVYEKIEANRPDIHHERLMEEWGYKK